MRGVGVMRGVLIRIGRIEGGVGVGGSFWG